MKKLLFCGAAAAIIAGCSSRDEPVTVFDATCEKVTKFDAGDMIVKCPMTPIMATIQSQKPNSRFLQTDGLPLQDFANDAEHIYVDVIPVGTYEGQLPHVQYRVLLTGADVTAEKWAVALIAD